MFEVIVALKDDPDGKSQGYARLEFRGRCVWKTKSIAERHAREFKALHLRDAWVAEVE